MDIERRGFLGMLAALLPASLMPREAKLPDPSPNTITLTYEPGDFAGADVMESLEFRRGPIPSGFVLGDDLDLPPFATGQDIVIVPDAVEIGAIHVKGRRE